MLGVTVCDMRIELVKISMMQFVIFRRCSSRECVMLGVTVCDIKDRAHEYFDDAVRDI